MKEAAARFVGVHDFASFAASTGSEDDDRERNMVREIFATELKRTEDGKSLWFTVHGRSVFEVHGAEDGGDAAGGGKREVDGRDIERLYEMRDRRSRGRPVPAQGLWMVRWSTRRRTGWSYEFSV